MQEALYAPGTHDVVDDRQFWQGKASSIDVPKNP